MTPNGIIIRLSQYSVKETIDRLVMLLGKNGATVYARINQQSEANGVGLNLRPLEFLLFGNPKVGGVVMAENPLVALDLPLKTISWEDDEKKVWVAYNDSSYIAERYSLRHEESSPFDLNKIIDMVLEK